MTKDMFSPTLIVLICLSMLGVTLCPGHAIAADCDPWMAKVVSVQGMVQVRATGDTLWKAVSLNDTFCPGDMVRVGDKSRAAVVLSNEAVVRLDQKTTLTFSGIEKKKVWIIDLIKGAAQFFSRTPRSLKVNTPFVNGAVEGTEFYVKVNSQKTFLSVFQGRVLASNAEGSLSLGSNQSVIAWAGKAPVIQTVVNPRDAVRWALYYPAIHDYRPEDIKGNHGCEWKKIIRKSIQFYQAGDLVGAFSSLDQAPENIPHPGFYIYRASLLLSVGRVDEAGPDIQKAMDLDPLNSHGLALKSIIAIAQNRKQEGLDLAEKAIQQDPKSSDARIALSYAQQSRFQVQEALESLQKAVALSSKDALAWARLSELWLSAGDLDQALEAAHKAASLNPLLGRTHAVLGFAYLTQIRTKEAIQAFRRAIELDQASPLARLGLGLAIIREGDLIKGRAEMEIAAGLAPNISLIRSYLGKAFFDEKRDHQSYSQLAVAKELDPLDPTPWFYDAIRKQTLNLPVEALHDLQKSIDLNDNRAVYRSRLLLDQDLAARSAGLGRIYNDLGFQQLGLVEGWKSVNTDPANYSAHRLLADSYATLPRHETARVSELLQSQLLQPINITPVQPLLAESGTFIYEGAGPATASFNEFNPLFLRNRLALQTSGVVGGNDIFGDEIVQSGVWGRMSYSIGQFHYETDGYRDNNDLDQDIYNVFLQASLTHNTSIQAEYRYKDVEKGDLAIKFDPDDYFPNQRENERARFLRIGGRHAFSPRSDLVAHFSYGDSEEDIDLNPFDIEVDYDGYNGEIQHLFRLKRFHLTSGVGYHSQDYDSVFSVTLPAPFGSTTKTETDTHSTNFYVYSLIQYPDNWTWTVGGSVDFYEGFYKDRDQFNPKFGITWNPCPGTTIRGAIFRTLKKILISDQTLEPTQVAGFNQFFDDGVDTDSWRYGIAIDQKFDENLFGGMEITWRDLEMPFLFSSTIGPAITQIRTADWEDDLARAYLYWTPHQWLTLSVEYQFEQLDRDLDAPGEGNEVELDTHKFPLGISFFHPSGFYSRIKVTYVDQNGKFRETPPPPARPSLVPGDDQFWVVDAAIGFRLPKRRGFISIEAKNLFDEKFRFQDTDPKNPKIYPERLFLAKFTLAF